MITMEGWIYSSQNFDDEYNVLYRTLLKILSRTFPMIRMAEVSLSMWAGELVLRLRQRRLDRSVVAMVTPTRRENHYRQRKLLFRNNRDGTLSEVAIPGGSALAERTCEPRKRLCDIDNDGDIDVIVNDLMGLHSYCAMTGNRNNSI